MAPGVDSISSVWHLLPYDVAESSEVANTTGKPEDDLRKVAGYL